MKQTTSHTWLREENDFCCHISTVSFVSNNNGRKYKWNRNTKYIELEKQTQL